MWKHVALAAITCSSGPPWSPGNTARSIACACSSRQRTRPDLGPASVLWVVDVTTSQCSTGFGWSPAATRPAKWAMSHQRSAPTSSAMRRNIAVSTVRGYAEPPQRTIFGRCSRASERTSSSSTTPVSRGDAVVDDRVEAAREVDLEAVGQVASVVEAQREHGVARLQQPVVHRHVRLGAGVRLDVRVLGAEKRLGAVDRELLDLVHDLAASVVALAGIALGVLVRRHRADGLEHARPREVLGGDQLDLVPLALRLARDQRRDVGVELREPRGPQALELVGGHCHGPDATAADGRRRRRLEDRAWPRCATSSRRSTRRAVVAAAAEENVGPAVAGERRSRSRSRRARGRGPRRARSSRRPGRRRARRRPPRPISTSAPPRPQITSRLGVPISLSGPFVPTIVQRTTLAPSRPAAARPSRTRPWAGRRADDVRAPPRGTTYRMPGQRPASGSRRATRSRQAEARPRRCARVNAPRRPTSTQTRVSSPLVVTSAPIWPRVNEMPDAVARPIAGAAAILNTTSAAPRRSRRSSVRRAGRGTRRPA